MIVALMALTLFLPAQNDGALRVKTDVSQVTVLVDGKEMGESPVTIPQLAPGVYKVTLVKAGYEDHTEEIKVQPGGTTRIFVVMKPNARPLPELPAKFRVGHQHRAGLCRGELTITAEAIHFKADDGKDVFHIPIKDIQSVSRSWGSFPFMTGGGIDLGQDKVGERMPFRVEAPGRSYGFVGHVDDQEWKDVPLDSAMTRVTKLMYDLVYRLWQDMLDARKKTAAR